MLDGLEIKCELTLPYKSGSISGVGRSPARVGRERSPVGYRRDRRSRTPPRGTGANMVGQFIYLINVKNPIS